MKQIVGTDVGSYSFDKVAKQVTITGLNPLTLEQILLITNVTVNKTIYQFNVAALGGTISGNIVTLDFDTSAMSNSDALQIIIDYEEQVQPISAAALPLPTGAATSAAQATGNASLASIDSKLTNPIPVTGPLTDTELRASAVPVSAASLPLPTGAATSSAQATGNASLASIDTKLTNPLPVSASSLPLPTGAATSANQTTANTSLASIDSKLANPLPVTGPLTDTQLRATAVPVSAAALPLPTGAATSANQSTANTSLASIDSKLTAPLAVTGPLTDAQLRATPVPVSGSITVTEASIGLTGASPPASANQAGFVDNSGNLSAAKVNAAKALTVDGSAVTQPVSATALPLPTGAATSANQTTANTSLASIDSKLTNPLPVSAAALPLPTGASTAANQTTLGSQTTKINDGTNTAAVKPASTAALATDPALVATLSPNGNQATAANQTSEIAVLNTIATNTGSAATDFVQTGTIAALNGTVSITGQGCYTVSAAISGTFVGTFVAEGQLQGGAWVQVPLYAIQTTLPYPSSFSGTAPGNFLITGGAYLNIRIRASAYTSGTMTVNLDSSLAQQTIFAAQLGTWNMNAFLGRATAQLIRNDYTSTNVTTGAYVQLVASTAVQINTLNIYDSSGQDLVLAVGAAASEVDQIYIPPGGWNQPIDILIPAGSRISVKAKSATANVGILSITGLK